MNGALSRPGLPSRRIRHPPCSRMAAPCGFQRRVSALAFWIESNPGEGFRPLAKIASGGELSRLMLALMGGASPRTTPTDLTLVLDEVDAGIGGETAIAVGAAVADLGRGHQVLAVTHLAQVAAQADHHGRLSKSTHAAGPAAALGWLAAETRVQELARLLSGHPDRPEALEHAKVPARRMKKGRSKAAPFP